ncbi:MAG: RNA polymerase sigma factor [Chitinophagales bacterium]
MPELNNIKSRLSDSAGSVPGHNDLRVLIDGCIARSRSAQKKLYDLYSPAAYGVIKRYMYNNDPVAQELLNDCFYKIFTKLEQYSFEGAFEGWIRRIVVNTVTDHLRKNIKDEQAHKEVQPEDVYMNSDSLEKISHKELLKIIHTLPEVQRTVFNLFVFENYSHKEIAALLNLNGNNCRWHLNDARRRLKEKINHLMK